MALVEVDKLRDSYVGVPGVSGLSVEQRKRLTLAVRAAACLPACLPACWFGVLSACSVHSTSPASAATEGATGHSHRCLPNLC
jgi:hypothetical protein